MIAFLRLNARWLSGGLLLIFTNAFGQAWFISLFAGGIMEAHGLSNGEWGGLFSLATLASAGLLFLRGSVADTIPLNRLAVAVSLVFALSCLGMAFAGSIWLLGLSLFGLRFCGQSMFGHIAMTAIGRWFRAQRGQAVSIVNLGGSAGKAIWPMTAALCIAAYGARATWIAVAILLAVIVTPLLGFLMARGRAPKGSIDADDGGPGLGLRHWTRSDVFHHWLFPALIPAIMTGGVVVTSTYIHQVHVANVNGWSLASIAPAYSANAVMTVIAALVAGRIADRFGPERLLPLLPLPLGLGMMCVAFGSTPVSWIAAFALIGVEMGVGGTVWGALLPRLYGTRHLGSVRSLVTTMMVASSAIGPAATGALLDAGVPFDRQCLVFAIWCFVLVALNLIILRRLSRETAANWPAAS